MPTRRRPEKTRLLQVISIRVPGQSLEHLRVLSEETGLSQAEHLRRAVEFYLGSPHGTLQKPQNMRGFRPVTSHLIPANTATGVRRIKA